MESKTIWQFIGGTCAFVMSYVLAINILRLVTSPSLFQLVYVAALGFAGYKGYQYGDRVMVYGPWDSGSALTRHVGYCAIGAVATATITLTWPNDSWLSVGLDAFFLCVLALSGGWWIGMYRTTLVDFARGKH